MTEKNQVETRNDAWLEHRIRLLISVHFSDMPKGYPIITRFSIHAQNRFGTISARDKKTHIRINRLFADPEVPDYVIDETLAHELAHYVHGFGSGLPRLYTDPHRGGVIEKELDKRGLAEVHRKAEQWRKSCWESFYKSRSSHLTARRTAREERTGDIWIRCIDKAGNRTEDELGSLLKQLAFRFRIDSSSPPFHVKWLHATTRQKGTSYYTPTTNMVGLHGLLSDRRIPDYVVEFELAYWIARRIVGGNWEKIASIISKAGMGSMMEQALNWRRRSWTQFRNRNHPLK